MVTRVQIIVASVVFAVLTLGAWFLFPIQFSLLGAFIAIAMFALPSLFNRLQVSLPKIDTVLKRGKFEGEGYTNFLSNRKEPYWTDFEEGYIARRPEVDSIISKLQEKDIHLILGLPSSGKTVIAKNIGFLLRKEGYDVFILELKKENLEVSDVLKEISKMQKGKSLLIIDDIHIGLTEDGKLICNELIRRIGDSKIKLLLVGRDVNEESDDPKIETELGILKSGDQTCTPVKAVRGIEIIGENFEEKSGISIPSSDFTPLKEKYGYDLWVFSLILGIYDPKRSIPTEAELLKYLKKILTGRRLRDLDAEDILLPISVFYSYEIPVESDFLTQNLGLNEKHIRKLADYGEISQKDNLIRLPHSSIASLYLKVFEEFDELGKNVKVKSEKGFANWHIGLMHMYLQSRPMACRGFLAKISRDSKKDVLKNDLISELLKNNETRDTIFKRFFPSGSAKKKNLKILYKILNEINNRVFTDYFLDYLPGDDLLVLFQNSKLNQIGKFLRTGYFSKNVRAAYIRFYNESLGPKMQDSSLEEIGVFLYEIRKVALKGDEIIGKKLAAEAIEKLKEVNNLPEKLETSTLETIAPLVKTICVNDVSGNHGFILDYLKPPFDLRSKIESAPINYLGLLMVCLRSNGLGYLVEDIDLNKKIQESDLSSLGYFLENISNDSAIFGAYIKALEGLDFVSLFKISTLDTINEFLWKYFKESSSIPTIFTNQPVRNLLVDFLQKKYLFELQVTKDNRIMLENLNSKKIPEALRIAFESNGSQLSEDPLFIKYSENRWGLTEGHGNSIYIIERDEDRLIVSFRENIGEQLCLIGLFEFTDCSLSQNGQIAFYTEIYSQELMNYFKKCLNTSTRDRYQIALALRGFKKIDEQGLISFVKTHNRVLDYLEKSTSKNKKSKQLIQSMINWIANDV
jgi:hypothetical protein